MLTIFCLSTSNVDIDIHTSTTNGMMIEIDINQSDNQGNYVIKCVKRSVQNGYDIYLWGI